MSADGLWPQSREGTLRMEDPPDDHRDGIGPWHRQQSVRNRTSSRRRRGAEGAT